MEAAPPKTRKSALRMATPAHVRRFSARLLNDLRNGELSNESAIVQVSIAEVLLKAMAQQPEDEQVVYE